MTKRYTFNVGTEVRLGANCGACEDRNECPLFAGILIPQIQESLNNNAEADEPIASALEHFLALRDAPDNDNGANYFYGGAVSYLQQVQAGHISYESDFDNCMDRDMAQLVLTLWLLDPD